MSDYVIYTDSGCDLSSEKLNEYGVKSLSLTYRFNDEEKEYKTDDMPIHRFYQQMRAGRVAKTAAVNTETFRSAFEAELKAGKDVLYIGFSSGLSSTSESAQVAAKELNEKYSDRRVIAIDTLCASAGEGMLVWLASKKRAEGASFLEVAELIQGKFMSMCHWFTVDDLVYLKRGGRVSPTVAFVGGLLGIKPVLHVDDEGHLIKVNTARGRKASLNALADELVNTILPDSPVWISHGDCEGDAKLLADIVREKSGKEVTLITDVGPVIGAHSGPGTMALFFLASKR